MHLSALSAYNFRSFAELCIEFPKGITLVLGDNGSGKSNLLEAIYYALSGKSFRTRYDQEIVMFGKDFLRTEAQVIKDGLKKKIKILFQNQNGRSVEVNEKEYSKLNQLFFENHVVVFTPSSSFLVKGGPHTRRHFLDRINLKINPEFSLILSKYSQTLKARNTLLKTKSIAHMDYQLYEVLTDELIRYSKIIQNERSRMLDSFNQQMHEILQVFQAKGVNQIKWIYQPFRKFNSSLTDLLNQESRRGISIIGSHLDIVDVSCNSYLAKSYSSEGEIKIITIFSKLCEFETIEKKTRITPILLLDDLSSELDEENLKKMLEFIKEKNQVILSSLVDLPVHAIEKIYLKKDLEKICNN